MNKNVLLKLDEVFPHLHDFGKFDVSYAIPGTVKFENNGLSYPTNAMVAELLQKHGYAVFWTEGTKSYTNYFVELTQKGRDAKAAGGHFAYLAKLGREEKEDKDRQTKTDEISKYDLLQKKYFYKSRYIPNIFSILALIGTAFSITIAYKALHKSEATSSPKIRIHRNKRLKISLFLNETLHQKQNLNKYLRDVKRKTAAYNIGG